MDPTTQISVVALIVSLVALLVTLLQALQQYFTTAEGYRRCAESVIGPWHKARRRHFVPSELRFETLFIAPQISLSSAVQLQEARETYGKVYMLNSPEILQNDACSLIKETVHPSPPSDMNAGLSALLVRCWGRPKPKQLDPEKKNYSGSVRTGAQRQKKEANYDRLANWIDFMIELHRVYRSYWPKDCDECKDPWDPADSVPVDESPSMLSSAYQDLKSTGKALLSSEPDPNEVRTDATVAYRHWNWDLMGEGTPRPLARTTVGDIVIFALRMGMQWRVLQPADAKMQADGNGYSLSGTFIPSLGILLSFSSGGRHKGVPRIVPSRSADKMLCGILPGDSQLVKMDFPMVDDNREILSADTILAQLGVTHDKMPPHFEYEELGMDLMKLLCCFLPLPGSTIARTGFAPWKQHDYSFLEFFESKMGLYNELQRLVLGQPEIQELGVIKDHLDHLRGQYSKDFYCDYRQGNLRNVKDPLQKKQLIEDCRAIFDYTTTALTAYGFDRLDGNGQTYYTHLVLAHIYMAAYTTHKTFEEFGRGRTRWKASLLNEAEKWRTEMKFDQHPANFRWLGNPQHFKAVVAQVQCLYDRNSPYSIRSYLLDKGFEITERDAEISWWLLMLRGIAWNMSCWRAPDFRKSPVQSSAYENATPVWLT